MSAVAYRPHYKIEDYLEWEGDWELWNGVAVAMSPSPDFIHQRLSFKLSHYIETQLETAPCESECMVVFESDWQVSEDTVVRPDFMVICEEPSGKWVKNPPELISEILSPSTRNKDLINKRELYAQQGVKFYLIADPDEKSLILLELDENGTYREIPANDPFEIHEKCSLQLNSVAIFP